MRLFFALALPKELKDRLASFQQQVKRLSPPASWPDPGGLHLTLAFLGERSDACVPSLMDVARRSASACQAFTLKTGALGGFPSDRRARILWLGMEEEPCLEALCTLLRQGLKQGGFAFDEKPFHAHLTLARFRSGADIGALGRAPELCRFDVRELVLFQSVTTPAGARYRGIDAAPLG